MHLYRFGGLVAESLNKSLYVLNLFALILVGSALVLESLLAQGHVLRVVGFVVVDAPKLYLYGACGGGIEEGAVVGDE